MGRLQIKGMQCAIAYRLETGIGARSKIWIPYVFLYFVSTAFFNQTNKKEIKMKKIESYTKPFAWIAAAALVFLMVGCGGGGGGASPGSASLGPVGTTCTGGSCVDLGTAASYVMLGKTGVSSTGSSVVTGNIGLSPAAQTFLTGWSLIAGPGDTYFTSAQVAAPGKLYAANNLGSTPSDLTTAVGNMETAYTAASGMAVAGGGLAGGVPGAACPGSGNFGSVTFKAGVFKCAVNVTIPTSMTLSGSATDVFVFEITGKLTQSAATQVILTGGALPQNVFWVVSGNVDIGTTATMQGVILGQTLINMQTGSTEHGRLLAQSAVTLGATTTVSVP
jgi:hypothetical protein